MQFLDLGEHMGSVQDVINLTENMDCFDDLSGVTSDYDLGYCRKNRKRNQNIKVFTEFQQELLTDQMFLDILIVKEAIV